MLPSTMVTTIERWILDQEDKYPEATGELSNLLYDIALAAKIIASSIRRAGLVNILGSANNVNVQGEEQQKLDVFANEPRVDPRYYDLPNVFMLPHIGSSTIEARLRMGRLLINALQQLAEGMSPSNRVA